MHKAACVILLALLLTMGCNNNSAVKTTLDRAESMMERDADSALTLINSIQKEGASMSRAQQMRCELLRAKAQNKASISFTSDSTMKAVADYYDRYGSDNERMMAYYLLGCVYRDMKDAPTALNYYKAAVAQADTTAQDCDWNTLCCIHSQTITLFHQLGSPDYELEEVRAAMNAAWHAKDTVGALMAYGYKASAYYISYKYDSVISVCTKQYQQYCQIGRNDLAAQSLPILIYVLVKKRQLDRAQHYIDIFERQSGWFSPSGQIIERAILFYDIKAEYFQARGQEDSAFFYYNKLLPHIGKHIMYAEAVYQGLMNHYQQQGNVDSVVKYSRLFAQANDSMAIVRSAEEINRTQALFNYDHKQRELEDKVAENRLYKFGLALIALAAIATGFAATFIYKRRHREAVRKVNRKYASLLTKLEQSTNNLQQMKNNLDQYKKAKTQEIHALAETIADYQDSQSSPVSDTERSLAYSTATKHLHKLSTKGMTATDTELETLVQLCQTMLPEFYAAIHNNSTPLNEKERYVCLLSRLHFIPTETAVLLDMTQQRTTNIRSAINKKLFNATGAKTLDYNLRRLGKAKV